MLRRMSSGRALMLSTPSAGGASAMAEERETVAGYKQKALSRSEAMAAAGVRFGGAERRGVECCAIECRVSGG